MRLKHRMNLLFRGLAVGIVVSNSLMGCATFQKCGSGECPQDAEINNAIEARLSQHAELEPPNLIRVQTRRHVVYLYGLVDTALERDMAESVARDTPGVTKVVNSIGISGNR
jgi:osmotically-inducible protein OsmY